MFAQRNPSTVTEMLPMAVPLLVGVVAVFSCATFLAAVVSSVALPQLGKKVSKVKLAEASSAHGTLMERSLALSVPLTKAVVAAAVGTAAYRFIDDTQNVRAAAISWILPNERKQAGKLAAVELLLSLIHI